MASNEFSLNSSSDSEVSEIEDYEIEVEGSPNSGDQADEDYADEETQEAYAYEPLADAEWLALYEQERRKEEELQETLQSALVEQ